MDMKKIERWLDGYKKWLDGWIKQIDGWLEGKQKCEKNRWMVGWRDVKIDGWLDGGIEKKQMDGWMDSKHRWLDG